ncbi:fumarylacetoacetate hydrolase family protein [Streptacidiphilus jiangxiensis]|uniref:2-keto-4-pentenoate hydratase/2-oxohepta-3-ene-1,7-dioic acid hydratase (Catechol pathway) n=1 Tax=Streptacidiphilus jiangxiensis TaxID=235985 RepID=A0A1H7G4Q8_STRJI|nr:fumarylacetoacetate hydrolase family protein [Streptacidiphilus jiangxiensis]SEK33129.1 2-keto-4-pentenoate hydratase/2-oxohepta-3-ene-1,7-dioic acid hydratase (catechol pathway) [Streptacidiphilus jiangxiensis]
MRFLRIGPAGAERPALLLSADAEAAYDLSEVTPDIDGSFLATLGPERRADLAARAEAGEFPRLPLAGARIGAPVARPGKVVCIGLNYRDHAAETGQAIPAEPVVFMKASDTVVGPYDEVLIPRGSAKTDWEVELAVVIGARARYLDSVEAADAVIAGYSISNDVSEREWQLERGGTWDKGKSCETFNPLGPWLVTADEVADPQALALRLSVNGEPRQDGSTANMIFDVRYVIWYLSQFMVLEPGDVVNTGTPAGVAMGTPGQPWLQPGDVMELSIDGLGAQRLPVGKA